VGNALATLAAIWIAAAGIFGCGCYVGCREVWISEKDFPGANRQHGLAEAKIRSSRFGTDAR